MFKRLAQKLRPSKPVYIDRVKIEYGEILSQGDCEAILFFMRPDLKWGGDLNHAILKLVGAELDAYIARNVRKPKSGDVFALPPFNTHYKALFMAILSDWDGGNGFEERDMLNCYRDAINQAEKLGIKTMVIPAMGRDKRDFPHIRFARLALQGILDRLDDRLDFVKIMCIDRTMMATYTAQVQKMKNRLK